MEPACSSQASVINNYSCCRRSGTRYQWRPNVSTSCALYKTRPNVRQRLGSELAAQRRTPRTHARTHSTQRLSVRSRIPEVRGNSWRPTCSAVTPCKLTAFFDTKYCWFLLAPKLLFKNPLQTRDKFIFTNFRYELRKRSSAQNELQDNTYVYVRDRTGNRKLTEKSK